MEVKTISLDKIKPAPYNPRINVREHPEFYEKLLRSIQYFGYVEPIVWNKRTGHIVGGNQRYEILKEIGEKEVEVVVVDLSLEDEKALNIALNKISGDWDLPKLQEVLNDLKLQNYEIDLTGFDEKEMDRLIKELEKAEVWEDDFDIEGATQEEAQAKYGDIYAMGRHHLMCGDATKEEDVKVLMGGEKADMVFTDPPYGVDYSGGRSQLLGKSPAHKKIKNDNLKLDEFNDFIYNSFSVINSYIKDGAAIYICHADGMAEQLLIMVKNFINFWKHGNEIVWYKKQPTLGYNDYRYAHECISYGWKGNKHKFYGGMDEIDVWEFAKPHNNERLHPTQKPMELVAKAIQNSSKVHDIVLDLFGGSGTTLIACEQLNRTCYMMEIDPVYVDVIIKRWENFTGDKAKLIKNIYNETD